MDNPNTSEDLQQAAQAAPPLTPEQIEETAHQLANATPIPGVSSEMLDAGKEALDTGLDVLGAVADVVGVVGTVVEVAVGVVGAVAEIVGSIDLGS